MDFIRNININWNWVDILVVIVVVRGIYTGVKNGLTSALFNFIGVILSLIVSVYWYSQVADLLVVNFSFPIWLSQFLCFVIIAQAIRVVFKYGIAALFKILNVQFAPQLERGGGALVGLARGIILSTVLVLALTFLPWYYIPESIYEKSFSGTFLIQAAERTYRSLTFWLPADKTERAIFVIPAADKKAQKI